ERAAAQRRSQEEERAAAQRRAQEEEERAAAQRRAQEAAAERRAQEETRKRKRWQGDDKPPKSKIRCRRPGFLGDFSSDQLLTRADQYSFPTPRYNMTKYLVELGPEHFVYERDLTHLRALR
ncbi:hypothetical protein P154DRAFT_580641, partial [Amniculicola lignicola CBS 123094]